MLPDNTGVRTVYHADAIEWLGQSQPALANCSMITSLPDISEFPNFSLEEWKTWFTKTAALVLSSCSEQGVTLFYQSDIKKNGAWVDKSYLCQKAAEEIGHELIAHKIICRAPPGRISFGRPAYSHLLCFAKSIKADISKSQPDVLPNAGDVTWTRGMGTAACKLACQMVLSLTNTRTIVNPFCGHGTILAVANQMGLNAIGIEKSKNRAQKAEELRLSDLKQYKKLIPTIRP